MNKDCARAEILAGAIALGEASDGERDEYRRHISACASCIGSLGGEREIERVMATVAAARESEMWEPVALRPSERRAKTVRVRWSVGVSTAALAIVASFGIHALIAANARPIVVGDAPAVSPVFHVSLERRPHAFAPSAAVRAKPAEPGIVVVHNVITLKESDRPETKPVRTTETVVARASAPENAGAVAKPRASNVPIWRRDRALPAPAAAAPVTVARNDAPPLLGGHAEAIAVAPSYIVRDAAPIGGDTAINPRPAPIAYSMGAEGTTAFEVSVDERGSPLKCTITKSSGYLVLDNAVCKAAMQARYTPRTVNGRATTGVYRDAFTFRASNANNEGIQ